MLAWMSVQDLVGLGYTLAELFDSLTGRIRLRTFVQYLIAFCRKKEHDREAYHIWLKLLTCVSTNNFFAYQMPNINIYLCRAV